MLILVIVVALSLLGLGSAFTASAQSQRWAPPQEQIAEPTVPGWSIDVRSGCRLWNSYPRSGDIVRWTGPCGTSGVSTGTGVAEWQYGGRVRRYEGEVRDGKPDGHGVYTLANGDRYQGDVHEDQPHGHGIYVWAHGDRYEGDMREGRPHGRGTHVSTNGDRYDGEWRDGVNHGRGVFTWADGSRYEGDWRNDRPHGYGVFTSGRRTRYEGQWRDGCFWEAHLEIAIGRWLSECPDDDEIL